MIGADPIIGKRRVYKIVLTGGPCSGKTTGQERLRTFFEEIGWKVYTVPETASILLGGGVKFEELSKRQIYDFQKDLLLTLLRIETVFFNQAAASNAERILIICDRGAMDPAAYIDKKSWNQILNETNLDQFSLREDRYDQVIHLITAADGAEEYYTLANNGVRTETVQEAIEQDRLTRDVWLGHPRVDVIENVGCKSFDDKILKLTAAICSRLGLPIHDRLAFNSKKRKWLVASFDEKRLPRCEVFLVRHAYLCTEDQNVQIRLRSRSQYSRTTYTITTRRYDGPEPVETCMPLNYREYINYTKMEDRSRAPINKERRCFMYGKQCYHLDKYTSPLPPSREGKPLMLLEAYTTAPVGDTNKPLLPDFMTILKEVTDDPEYSMYTIANRNAKVIKKN
ncbi:unnamed protein product [Cercopithifilaria johnstoni]|uniref:NadR/Ttd14 AAA domain-containing protein n=1 Tax=Cercopithifilaria johnstoni TaxID=2874296 RepID=A0A8J2LYC3_9BILA|nr:unnamed protein product [Cercopithifilaria johnstoni]